MFGLERQQKIKEILIEKESIEVQFLSEILSVSDVTIRRDLDKLEKEGFLVKTYGGAILKSTYFGQQAVQHIDTVQDNPAFEEKKMISEIATDMIENEEVIYLSPGPICLQIARNLKNKQRLKILTNDIFIAAELYNCSNVKVVLTGGDLLVSTGILYGPLAVNALHNIFISKAFINIEGIDLDYGYTVNSYDESIFYEEIIKKTNDIVIVAEHNRFNKRGFTKLAEINTFNTIVSGNTIPDKFKKYYFENNIKLYTSYAIY
jgi:DeoR family fructose operon transcriptional repressor